MMATPIGDDLDAINAIIRELELTPVEPATPSSWQYYETNKDKVCLLFLLVVEVQEPTLNPLNLNLVSCNHGTLISRMQIILHSSCFLSVHYLFKGQIRFLMQT